jgi:hypothetical protein
MIFECATDGCTTKTERRSPRHKYCDVCATKRKTDYNKVWYETIGAEWKRINYLESRGGILVTPRTPEAKEKTRQRALKRHREYQQRPEVRERRKKYEQRAKVEERNIGLRAEIIVLRRERRLQEERDGGRRFFRRRAKISEPYLPKHLIWGKPEEDEVS